MGQKILKCYKNVEEVHDLDEIDIDNLNIIKIKTKDREENFDMNKLKKGYDCRKEGLTWVVYNLFELKVNLDYHHFPKYLTHEQIDYLKKYAK